MIELVEIAARLLPAGLLTMCAAVGVHRVWWEIRP